MIKKILAFFICLIGVLLPWRLRVLYSEMLGWIAQTATVIYFGIARLIVSSLTRAKSGDKT